MALESRWEGDRQSWLLGRLRQGVGRRRQGWSRSRSWTQRRASERERGSREDARVDTCREHFDCLSSSGAVGKTWVYSPARRHGEARFGSAEHAHHHAVCTRCGQILELDAALVSRLLSGLEAATAFRPDSLSGLTLRGVCETCLTGAAGEEDVPVAGMAGARSVAGGDRRLAARGPGGTMEAAPAPSAPRSPSSSPP